MQILIMIELYIIIILIFNFKKKFDNYTKIGQFSLNIINIYKSIEIEFSFIFSFIHKHIKIEKIDYCHTIIMEKFYERLMRIINHSL